MCSNQKGVTVSYFEWQQNRRAETWSADLVEKKLKGRMVKNTNRVKEAAKLYKCDLRMAAYCAALEHFTHVYEIRGIFP